jgi:hypothetical protein
MASSEESDEEFERSLLASAEGDEPAVGSNERAYAHFVAAAGLLATGAGVAARNHAAAQVAARSAKLAFGSKCALVGVLGGSALTFAWFGGAPPAPTIDARASASASTSASVTEPSASVVAAVASAPTSAPPPSPAVVAQADAATRARWIEARTPRPTPPLAAASPSAPNAEASSLSAEIASLDRARAALATSPHEALALVARYRQAFPRGKLRPEADVLAIEAHAANGETARATAAAAAFLRAHPNAPQRDRVIELTHGPR